MAFNDVAQIRYVPYVGQDAPMRRRFIGLYFSIFPPVAAGTALLSDRIRFIVPQFFIIIL